MRTDYDRGGRDIERRTNNLHSASNISVRSRSPCRRSMSGHPGRPWPLLFFRPFWCRPTSPMSPPSPDSQSSNPFRCRLSFWRRAGGVRRQIHVGSLHISPFASSKRLCCLSVTVRRTRKFGLYDEERYNGLRLRTTLNRCWKQQWTRGNFSIISDNSRCSIGNWLWTSHCKVYVKQTRKTCCSFVAVMRTREFCRYCS